MKRNVLLGLVAAGLLFSGPSRATPLITEEEAKLPPGEYAVRVDIRDSDGRSGTAIFTLKVAPK